VEIEKTAVIDLIEQWVWVGKSFIQRIAPIEHREKPDLFSVR
jgi:hypothetical protein